MNRFHPLASRTTGKYANFLRTYSRGIIASVGVSTAYCMNRGDRKYLKAKREEKYNGRFLPAVYFTTMSLHTIVGGVYGLGCGILGPIGWITLAHTIVSKEPSVLDLLDQI